MAAGRRLAGSRSQWIQDGKEWCITPVLAYYVGVRGGRQYGPNDIGIGDNNAILGWADWTRHHVDGTGRFLLGAGPESKNRGKVASQPRRALALGLCHRGVILVIPIVTSILSLAFLALTVIAWMRGYSSLVSRLYYSLVALAGVRFIQSQY